MDINNLLNILRDDNLVRLFYDIVFIVSNNDDDAEIGRLIKERIKEEP